MLKKSLESSIKNLFNIESPDIFIEHPENGSWGDYSTNICFKLAPLLKESPIKIAEKLTYELNDKSMKFSFEGTNYDLLESISFAAPGFINFKLSQAWLQHILYTINVEGATFGSTRVGAMNRIALEHSNVNPNKAAHIGHLRNACIGQFIERVYEFINYDVEVQYYVNDVGLQVATSLLGTKHVSSLNPENYEKYDHYAWDVYSKISKDLEVNANLKKELSNIMVAIEDQNSEIAKDQAALADRILLDQLHTFSKLDIDYDILIHERDILYLKFWEDVFEILKGNDRVYYAKEGKSAGCWLVKLSDVSKTTSNEDIEEDKIIVRANGVPTYTGKDIAYHMWKYGLLDKDFYYHKVDVPTQEKALYSTSSNSNPINVARSFKGVEYVFNVIDGRQSYAINTVRKSLEFLGYESAASKMTHINYGFVYLSALTASQLGIDTSDGKSRYGMSGRKGWGIKIDDFINIIDDALILNYGDFESKKDVRNGAIKFEMLKYNTYQDLVFDLENATSIKGYSGPYIQYTHARCFSLLEKSDFDLDNNLFDYHLDKFTSQNLHMSEKEILSYIYRFPEVVIRSADEFAPNLLCNYLFELSQRYNTFYNELPVLKETDDNVKYFRLLLTSSVKQVLHNGLFLLGIKAPNAM